MTWWEVLISIPILAIAGAFAGHFIYQWEVRKYGQIKVERDELVDVARKLGLNPDDVRAMGLMWAASGLTVEEAQEAAVAVLKGETDGDS